MKIKTLSLVLACTLIGSAFAAVPAKPTNAEQQAARAEIDSLVQRIQELSKKLGPDNSVMIQIQRADHGVQRPPDGPGRREVIIERMAPESEPGPGPGPGSMSIRPGIGIVMAPNPAANGVLIGAVTPDGPAAKAGLRSGDVLLSVNGKSIAASGKEGVNKARELLSNLKVGQNLQLVYARAGKAGKADVKVDNIGRMIMLSELDAGVAPRANMHSPRMMRGGPNDREDIEIIAFSDCENAGKKNCAPPRIFEAMRWQGLNLASMDAQLGRYFGTDKGVLIISAGPGMKGLQSGDVIQRIETTTTQSPRDVMRVLREKKVGEKVSLNIMRDRKPLKVEITTPEAKAIPFLVPPPAPPSPPAPPTPPRAPGMSLPPAPPAPPAKPIGMRFDEARQEQIVWISRNDEDGGDEIEIEIAK